LEEWDFLDETCLTALYASKDVSFAAVVDINGKLIVGKYRKRDRRTILSILSDTYSISPATTVTSRCYTFYSDYLVKAIRRSYFENKNLSEDEKEETNFEMIDFIVIIFPHLTAVIHNLILLAKFQSRIYKVGCIFI
jgi:hypothetical protein